MKKVLTTFAVFLMLTLAVALDSGPVYAAGRAGAGASADQIVPPADQNGSGGMNGQGGATGDPDDLGGGFRSTSGPRKKELKVVHPPLTPFERLEFGARLYWMMIVSSR